jgi:integrase
MPRLHLTERAIAKLAAPDPTGKQAYHWDIGLRGFGVLCSGTSGAKSYICQRDINGRSKRLKIGAVGELSLAKARLRAAEALDDLRQGILPAVKADRNTTLRAAVAALVTRSDLRPASVRAYKMPLRTLAAWADWPLRNVNGDAVEKRHRELGASIGRHTANASMRALSAVWAHAAERVPDLPSCPVRRLKRKWFKEERRKRLVANDRLTDFYNAVMGLDNAIVRDCLLLMMFTGMRSGESKSLRFDDIDLAKRTINLRAEVTKGKRSITLPMSDYVHDLLVARRALGRTEYVFPGSGKSGYISDLQCAFNEIKEQTGIKISAHDLRRGFITCAESIGLGIGVIKQLVNHAAENDVTIGYVIIEDARLQAATQALTNRLKELCGVMGPAGENIEKLVRNKYTKLG